MSKAQEAFNKQYKLLPNGKYKYIRIKKVMFDKSVEDIFAKMAEEIKKQKNKNKGV